jgi:hypothetical protein
MSIEDNKKLIRHVDRVHEGKIVGSCKRCWELWEKARRPHGDDSSRDGKGNQDQGR